MSQLLNLRAAVVTAISEILDGWNVESHLGRFGAGDLTTFLTKAPAVRVAILGFADAKSTGVEGELECTVRLGVFIITRDGRTRLSRDEAVCAAAERIALLAEGARWGLDFAYPARPGAAQNLFSDETLAKGAALWALDIAQPVVLTAMPAGEDDPLTALYIGLAPEIGPDHVDDYLGPFPQEALGEAANG